MESDGEILDQRLIRVRLSSMPYKELQRTAKRHSVCARGKKDELVARILPFMLEENKAKSTEPDSVDAESNNRIAVVEVEKGKFIEESDEENMQIIREPNIETINRKSRSARRSQRQSMAIRQESPMHSVLNRTYSLSPRNSQFASVIAQPLITNDHDHDGLQLGQQQLSELPGTPKSAHKGTHVTSISGSRAVPRSIDRFAAAHTKLQDDMQSIGDHRRRVLERHEAYQAQTPKRFKELATPKTTRSVQKILPPVFEEADPKKMTFKFGSVSPSRIQSVQNEQMEPCSSKTKSPARVVKEKDVRPLTVPKLSKRLNDLAAPKSSKCIGSGNRKEASSGNNRQHVPRRGRHQYIDTTKLSDKEFERVTGKNIGTGRAVTNNRQNNIEEQKLKRERAINQNRNVN